MNNTKSIALFLTMFLAVPASYATNFNPGSIEIGASSLLEKAKIKLDSGDYNGARFYADILYYPARNFAFGVELSHYEDDQIGDYSTDTWSPLVAINLSLDEQSGFLVGAGAVGLLKGEISDSGTTVDISGNKLFIDYRYYINRYIGIKAGLSRSKTTYELGSFSQDTTETAFDLGFSIALPK